MNKALEAAQAADSALETNNGAHNSAAQEKKKQAIARKMRALTAQISQIFRRLPASGTRRATSRLSRCRTCKGHVGVI